jgi:hypothetical protein
MSNSFESGQNFEMAMFGLNPENPRDVQEWLDTAPVDPDKPVADYSQDPFVFGTQQPVTEEEARKILYPRMPGH